MRSLAATVPAAPVAARERRRVLRLSTPYLYLIPVVALLVVFTYWPLIYTAYLSFVRWNFVADTKPFVGLANYASLMRSTQFQAAAENTVVYVLASIPLKVLLPLPVAFFIWCMAGRVGTIYKTVVFIPTLLSFVVVAIAWSWILNPYIGTAKEVLVRLTGLSMPPLLQSSSSAIWVIIGMSSWKVMGFHVLLYLAGLVGIDRQYIESMRLDGASDWQIFRHLVWPLLTPTTFFVLIITVIFSLHQVFTPIDLLTEGGPSNSTTNLFYVVYQFAFRTFNVGLGSAGTVVLFLLLVALTLIKAKLLERYVHYR
ncbi:MAG TPA: sugar ABC transporter permease [Geminicoccaceae bacterium]|nr:sugar ABC transporter permease [Geminicoccus sp.]HMU50805.1 sugar ABC transporter permease [Geminicoccaceae bacterium]